MLQRLKTFYEEYESEIKEGAISMGCMALGVTAGYLILTPFMIIWKKLGLYEK